MSVGQHACDRDCRRRMKSIGEKCLDRGTAPAGEIWSVAPLGPPCEWPTKRANGAQACKVTHHFSPSRLLVLQGTAPCTPRDAWTLHVTSDGHCRYLGGEWLGPHPGPTGGSKEHGTSTGCHRQGRLVVDVLVLLLLRALPSLSN